MGANARQPSPPASSPPQIIPFRPPARTSALRPTMRQGWEQHLRPTLLRKQVSRDWLNEHETHVAAWERFRGREASEFVGDVRRAVIEEFQVWCRQHLRNKRGEPVTARTVNKYCDTIEAVLQSCVRAEILASSPRVDPLPTCKAARRLHLDYEEADAIKRACRIATWPGDLRLPAPLWWETAFVGWCLYGFRTQEWAAYSSEAAETAIRWSNLHSDPLTPHPDGKAVWRHGWLSYVPEKQRRFKADPLVLPIPDAMHSHLAELRRITGGEGLVLPMPFCHRSFYAQWKRILDEAGVRPRPGLDGSQPAYEIKHLRKTATRWINDHGATIGCPGIGDFVTGHAADRSPDREVQSAVTRLHYDFAEGRLLSVLTTLPLPPSFAAPLCQTRRQLTLF